MGMEKEKNRKYYRRVKHTLLLIQKYMRAMKREPIARQMEIEFPLFNSNNHEKQEKRTSRAKRW